MAVTPSRRGVAEPALPAEPARVQGWPARATAVLWQGGPVIALLLLCIYLSLATPHFLTWGNILNIARQTAINIILAVGQTLIIIGAGIDLSIGATMALSAGLTAVATTAGGGPVAVAIPPGLATGSLVAFL
ncbi:MAG: hypothetical protein DIU76_11075, partial [Bacillota bacterium]